MRLKHFVAIAILGTSLCASGPSIAQAEVPNIEWTRQLGTSSSDEAHGVSVDTAGNVYITGFTEGALGDVNAGLSDTFLTKFDPNGTELWTTQIGSSTWDQARDVSLDTAGNVYITGFTEGILGNSNAGLSDAFLTKFDPNGTELWTTQIGSSTWDQAQGVSLDATGNVYITGFTNGNLGGPNAGSWDAFLTKFDPDGTELWSTQFGTSNEDRTYSVCVGTDGNAYAAGWTGGSLDGLNLGSKDAFLTKIDPNGAELWTRQFGTSSNDQAFGVSVDTAGNAYVTGFTLGNFDGPNAGLWDAFLAKYDTDGTALWTRQLGSSISDQAFDVSVDGDGNAYLTGWTDGSLNGPNAGLSDAFLAKYNTDGIKLWTAQLGTSSIDESRSVFVGTDGNAYLTGWTDGGLDGLNAGDSDVFVTKISESVPCEAANLDGIGLVDFADFAILSTNWLLTGPGLPGDIDANEIVDSKDLSWLIFYWLTDCNPL